MKFSKPYILLAFIGALLLLLSFFSNDRTIDIHVHDTVFIIPASHIFGSLGFLLLFFWLIYNLAYKIIFSKALAWIHIISTIVFFISLVLISFLESFYFLNQIALGLSIIAVLAQLLFLINIFTGLIKKLLVKPRL